MIIERNLAKFIVFVEDSILSALNKISSNKSHTVFAVSESGVLEGVLTDGDFRRWVVSSKNFNLNVPVSSVINKNFVSYPADQDIRDLPDRFSAKISILPLVDAQGRLVSVAMPGIREISLGSKSVSEDSPAYVIAEIGNNHNGSLELAYKLIDEAYLAGADCAKFQMRDLEAVYKNKGNPNDDSADLGTQYTLDLLSRFQLSADDLFRAFDYCHQKKIQPLCTPWDLESLTRLEAYGMPAYKVASADFTNTELLDALIQTKKALICSTGMSTESEILDGIKHLKRSGTPFVLLHCNSTYPAPFKDINLKYMIHLKALSDTIVGYSGHERDINVSLAAVTLGAKIIEKHFTMDRDMEGNDHKVSLLPSEFTRMVDGIRQIEESLAGTAERTLSQGELMNRENLAKSLVATVDIERGTPITEEMLTTRSPGIGIQPNRKKELVGKKIAVSKKSGEFLFPTDFEETHQGPRSYRFSRQWGVPVRYHDLATILPMANLDLVEIHLSFKDLELNFKDYIPKPLPLGLVVHAPELFKGDHTLDLCSADEEYRKKSIVELQSVINLTRQLSAYFTNKRPCIVTNIGGFSHHGHIEKSKRGALYDTFKTSLGELDYADVNLIPQTMPPFPWHFGGQQFHNLFVDPEEIVEICKNFNLQICLDTSHSKLACNFLKISFDKFLKDVAPFVAHLHLADARGIDGEGHQIGQGDIDWVSFWKIMNQANQTATFIPEIWQGHKNQSQGAWIALDALEQFYNASLKG